MSNSGNTTSKFYRFSCLFVNYFGLILLGILAVSALLFTAYAQDMSSQKVLFASDGIGATLIGLLAFGLLGTLAYLAALRNLDRSIKYLRRFVLLWYLLLGGIWIVFARSVPAADALSVYRLGEAFAEGNLSVMVGPDSYLSYYPHQIGFATVLSIFIRLWKFFPGDLPAYHFLKLLQVLLTGVILLYMEKIVGLLWNSRKVHFFYLLLMLGNMPLLMYSSFVYGEVAALAAFVTGAYYLLAVLQEPQGRLWKGALSTFLLALSVVIRKNSLVLILAVLLLLVYEGFHQKRSGLWILAVCVAVAGFGALPCLQSHYEKKAEYTLAGGVTAMSYFAMGMQESSRANGWYNGFNFETYANAGLDTEVANQVSREAIAERLQYFKDNPGYCIAFYWDKFRSQWLDGTYAGRQATIATFGGRSSWVTEIYEGKWAKYYVGYCNIWQNFLYIGSFLYFLRNCIRRKHYALAELFLMICVIGGFLFHGIWEANARYIFPYAMLLIPYAARGLEQLTYQKKNKSK